MIIENPICWSQNNKNVSVDMDCAGGYGVEPYEYICYWSTSLTELSLELVSLEVCPFNTWFA